MKATSVTRTIVIALAGGALALAAPAAADSGPSEGVPSASGARDQSGIVMRRDGSIAVPFRAHSGTGQGKEPVFRRDGSKAVAFVPGVGTPARATGSDGFDWGDAGVGAASAFGLVLLASGALILARRTRRADVPPNVSPDGRTLATRG